jgi:hypothetical protein
MDIKGSCPRGIEVHRWALPWGNDNPQVQVIDVAHLDMEVLCIDEPLEQEGKAIY